MDDDEFIISIKNKIDPKNLEQLNRCLEAELMPLHMTYKPKPLSILIHTEAGQLIAGLYGETLHSWLHIEKLWVHKRHRSQKVGLRLMKGAEKEAKRRKCKHAFLSIPTFFNYKFFLKLGYQQLGELDNFPKPHSRLFLRKKL